MRYEHQRKQVDLNFRVIVWLYPQDFLLSQFARYFLFGLYIC